MGALDGILDGTSTGKETAGHMNRRLAFECATCNGKTKNPGSPCSKCRSKGDRQLREKVRLAKGAPRGWNENTCRCQCGGDLKKNGGAWLKACWARVRDEILEGEKT